MIGPFPTVLALVAAVQSAPARPAGWVEFTPKNGMYRAAFPARPTEVVRKVERGGRTLNLASASNRKGAVVYTVACGEFAAMPMDPRAVLDGCRDEIVRAMKGRLVAERAIEFQGHPGRSIEIEIPPAVMAGGGKAWARVYLIGPQLFELTAVQPAKGAALNPAQAEAFLASLQPGRVPKAEPAVTAAEEAAPPAPAAPVRPDPAPAAPPAISGIQLAEQAGEAVASMLERKPENRAPSPMKTREALKRSDRRGPTQAGWKIFRPDEGGLSVELPPFEPQRMEAAVETPLGKLAARGYTLVQRGVTYHVALTDEVPGQATTVARGDDLAAMQRGMLGKLGATLVKEVPEGPNGRSFEATLPARPGGAFPAGGMLHTRLVRSGLFIAQVSVVIPKGTDAGPEPFIFLRSVRLEPTHPDVRPLGLVAANAGAAARPARRIAADPPMLPAGWTPYTAQDGTYGAAFPRPSRESRKEYQDGPQRSIVTETSARGPKLGVFVIQCAVYPNAPRQTPAEVEQNFDAVLQDLSREYGGQVVESEPIRLGEVVGRQARMEIAPSEIWPKGGTLFIRLYSDDIRMYSVMAIAQESVDRDWPLLFLDSFRIHKR